MGETILVARLPHRSRRDQRLTEFLQSPWVGKKSSEADAEPADRFPESRSKRRGTPHKPRVNPIDHNALGHGTLDFEPWIAGKGVANHESFKEAVYLAIDIYNKRNEYQGLIKNPLKTKEKQL